MKQITINLHYSSREEVQELKDYLEKNCWDWKEENPDDSSDEQ